MIFAISMDYTVFLLSSAKEHWDRTGDPREAMVGGVAHSGRVIFAAAAVMVAVFFTFALSGPLPPKEMGVILGVAVLLDALLVRLLLVPVLLRLLGRWAWWLPRWLDRVLPDVRFGHSQFASETAGVDALAAGARRQVGGHRRARSTNSSGERDEALDVGEIGGEPERGADGAARGQPDRVDVVVERHPFAELAADERLARDREGDLAGAGVAEAAGAQRDVVPAAMRST